MNFINIVALAIALAMDAFAVAIASGIIIGEVTWKQTIRLSFHFGLFQALMPLIGWFIGIKLVNFVGDYDHWIAFALLAYISLSMLWESFQVDEVSLEKDPTRGAKMVMLSIATSIDALAVGFSMSMLKISVYYPAIVIGIVAFIFTLMGMRIGERIGNKFHLGAWAERMGAIVIMLIGIKILSENGVF